jgi:hypothetical protein
MFFNVEGVDGPERSYRAGEVCRTSEGGRLGLDVRPPFPVSPNGRGPIGQNRGNRYRYNHFSHLTNYSQILGISAVCHLYTHVTLYSNLCDFV